MHANAWASLLQHIPAEQHSKLMLVTAAGVEITIQTILRIDQEFLAFKGRMAGSQDQGRLFFVPYHNIDYINFQYAVKDEDYHAMFGNLKMPDAPALGVTRMAPPPEAPPVPASNGAVAEAHPEPPAEVEPEPVAVGLVSPSSRTPLKSAVLERFRSRGLPPGALNPDSTQRPPGDG